MTDHLADKRRLKRHRLSTKIEVIDRISEKKVGQLANIHQQGMMLIGKELNVRATHQFAIILPNSINQQLQFELGVECLWCQQSQPDTSLYWTGCSIIDKSALADACIESLINHKNS